MAEEVIHEREMQRILRYTPRGYVPIFYKTGEMIGFLNEEQCRKLIAPFIYSELLKPLDELIRRRVTEEISVLERRWAAQRSLIGVSLCAMILAVSVILSSLSFFAFNIPEIGVTFLYGAVVALGGMVFIWYRAKKERI
jgi:hypothetical protein